MQFDTTASKHFFTISELASAWRVSVPHVHNLIQRGEIRAFRVGRRYIIRQEDAQKFLERGATTASAAAA